MVDNFSASASEIFAAAIQDYKRGLVIGSKHTYGKGTVQNVIDLNQFIRENTFGDLGALKTTTQKFYRINGGSTQLKGVLSDIVLPDRYAYLDMGERDEKEALPWDKIEQANYKPVYGGFETIIANSKVRIDKNDQFKLINENAKWIFDRKDIEDYNLSIDKFKTEIANSDTQLKKFKSILDYKNELKFGSLPFETALFANDSLLKEKRQRWYDDMQKDVYVDEAVNILNDLKASSKNKPLAQTKIKKQKLVD